MQLSEMPSLNMSELKETDSSALKYVHNQQRDLPQVS